MCNDELPTDEIAESFKTYSTSDLGTIFIVLKQTYSDKLGCGGGDREGLCMLKGKRGCVALWLGSVFENASKQATGCRSTFLAKVNVDRALYNSQGHLRWRMVAKTKIIILVVCGQS